MSKKKMLKVTLLGSRHGRNPRHSACILGLGLSRRHQTVELEDTACIRGMVTKISYLLKVEELTCT